MEGSSEIVLIKDKPAIVLFPSKQITMMGHRSLNTVMYEDGSLQAVRDSDIIELEHKKEE